MLLKGVVFVFCLVHISYGLSYDDLAKDECFKRIYICGDHRVSITGGTGHLVADPYRFGEVCRRHKEFMACIDEAANFCAGNFSDLAKMIFDNRRSIKMFCTDFEWKKNYFQSAACINRREQEVKDKCRVEEDERIDDRPWWCLIPEPCEAIRRVFDCTVRKMEKRCGSIAAEVFRRFHLLKVENQDVVCELRILNPRYCRYQITKAPSLKDEKVPNLKKEESIRRIGALKPLTSEVMNNLITAAVIDSVSLLKKLKLLSLKLQDSKEFMLKNLLSINYKLKALSDFDLSRESITPGYSKDFAEEISSVYETENDKMKKIKDSIYKLYELFNDKDLIFINEDQVELSLKDVKKFPIEHMSCFWLRSSQNSFKCDIRLLSLKQTGKMDTKDFNLWKHLSNISTATQLDDLLNFVEFESSLTDSEEFNHSKETEPDSLVFISIDDSIFISSLNSSDIHRSGLQLDDQEQIEDFDDIGKGKIKTSDSNVENEKQEFNMYSPPPQTCDEHLNSFGKLNKNSKHTFQTAHNFEQFSEFQNEELQLRKLEDVLNKRFQNVDIFSNVKDSKSSETKFSTKLKEDLNENSSSNICLENIYDAEHCKTNINSDITKSFSSNHEVKLNRNQILLEVLNFAEI